MRQQRLFIAGALAVTGLLGGQASAQVLYTEDFDSLAGSLGPSVNERAGFPLVTAASDDANSAPESNAFTRDGSSIGFTVDNTLGTFNGAPTIGNAGVPTGGVEEWEGWSFARKDFWIEADDQQRSTFTLGVGTVAVADPDEYYDLGDGLNPGDLGYYNTSLSTPSIGLATLGFGVGESLGVNLSFDSSYRVEALDDSHPDALVDNLNNQSGEVVAVFDSGEVQSQLIFDSTVDSDATNATEVLNFFPTDQSATSVQFFYNMGNAGNDWWWAIDNIEVADIDSQSGLPTATTYSEDFETLTLGDSVNERRSTVPSRVTANNDDAETSPVENAFTHTPPAGWTRTNNGPSTISPDAVDDNDGVLEWEGWSFTTPEFWTFADTQERELFGGTGVIAVADGDEWDDLGPAASNGLLDTVMETPEIDLTGVDASEQRLLIEFDASWRDEDDNTAIVVAEFDTGETVDVIRWVSDQASEFFFDDASDTDVAALIAIPDGATSVSLSFQYIGGNDWWFAVDNISVTAIPEPTSFVLLGAAAMGLAAARRR